ncbi:hypothetical protein RchiOBHm_Chr1g0324451 [Rosa chinensis]|uniref:Uncharacterized protein n=1 Tax=Rosa chinensis TaxID=74649 RepID=A0A2P6S9U5_ROSCH|nr:hypothetical protein RchiOBHm_Chr1g0324451 [Rosa chinensis]
MFLKTIDLKLFFLRFAVFIRDQPLRYKRQDGKSDCVRFGKAKKILWTCSQKKT